MLKSIIIAIICLGIGFSAGNFSQRDEKIKTKFWKEESYKWQDMAKKELIMNDSLQQNILHLIGITSSMNNNYNELANATIGLAVTLKKKYPSLR